MAWGFGAPVTVVRLNKSLGTRFHERKKIFHNPGGDWDTGVKVNSPNGLGLVYLLMELHV